MLTPKNKKIGWIEISSKKYGGVAYNEEARKILGKSFNVELILKEARIFRNIRYFKIPESLFLLIMMKGEKDIWIRDFYSTLTLNKKKTKGKNMAMIHHIDSAIFPPVFKIFFVILEKFFYRNLRKIDFIITVSEYWEKHFLEKGYKNVFKIYNGFNLSDFHITEKEMSDFRKKYGLSEKPIIYLGNCQKQKGVVESYKELKDLDVIFVTSGQQKVKIPATNLDLEYKDYLKLLKASLLVITMSKMKEGWCRTAHEAMLCKTPVIGSGLGGMRELLDGGNQIICPDFKNLKKEVECLLGHPDAREKMGESGYNFAKNFTQERFEKSWLDLINKILK
jgi:glycosyltransferase involved in cell wall biosynthesis